MYFSVIVLGDCCSQGCHPSLALSTCRTWPHQLYRNLTHTHLLLISLVSKAGTASAEHQQIVEYPVFSKFSSYMYIDRNCRYKKTKNGKKWERSQLDSNLEH